MHTKWLDLPGLHVPLKALFTGYLIVVGFGFLAAGTQILLTHGMADGKLGLSMNDIVYSFYGNRENSRLEAKLRGSMSDKATPEENEIMIQWARRGAPFSEWESTIKPIVDAKCAACHTNIPTLPNVTLFEVMQESAEVDKGPSIEHLTRVSHIHLFGMSFIFFFIGLIFSMAVGFNPWIKGLIIFIPFFSLALDVAGWWLTKLNPGFAWMILVAGLGYGSTVAIMLLTSLYQMWLMPLARRPA